MNPTAELIIERPKDREWIWLSDSLTARLTVNGPAPLVVTVPKVWLREDSAHAWRVQTKGLPKSVTKPDGTASWSLDFRLDPYLVGEKVPLAFLPLKVTTGTREREIALPEESVQVKTRFTNPKPSDAAPITGFIDPPPLPHRTAIPVWAWILGPVLLLCVAVILRRRAPRPVPPPTVEQMLQNLRLRSDEYSDGPFAEELNQIVRTHLERTYAIPADRLATMELANSVEAQPFLEILNWSDDVRFGGMSGGDRIAMLEMVQRQINPPPTKAE